MTHDDELGPADIGVVGLAVMGRNLALNICDHDFRVATWNLESGVAAGFARDNPEQSILATETLSELVTALKTPRVVLVMIRAGEAVDAVIEQLSGLLTPGDTIVDGGNSRYQDTRRREAHLRQSEIHFVGMGVSGGEEGARRGPSLMPGGSKEAWLRCQPIFEAIAARSSLGACVTHVGPDGAGHFVKMVHNGIEYGDMQLIAEAYDILSRGAELEAADIGKIFKDFHRGPLASFLVDLTARVLQVKDKRGSGALVDQVLDQAEQKGTGRWTVEASLALGVPIPTISAAVDARSISAHKPLRLKLAAVLGKAQPTGIGAPTELVRMLHDALLLAKVCAYAQGLSLIASAAERYEWNVDIAEVARIWTGGCIIRARLLQDIRRAFGENGKLPNLLLDARMVGLAERCQNGLRAAVSFAVVRGIPTPALSASLAYFDSLRSERLPQNLTQAQRDAFGAHTYRRVDDPDGDSIHTEWLPKSGS